MTAGQRKLFITLRAALILAINTLDDLLGYPRTIPRRNRADLTK